MTTATPATPATPAINDPNTPVPISEPPKEGCGCGGGEIAQNAQKTGIFAAIRGNIRGVFDKLGVGVKIEALSQFYASEVSDVDKLAALEAALMEVSEIEKPYYIQAVYDSYFIYACLDDTYNWHTYQRTYSVAEGGAVTISSDFKEVRPETKYVPLDVVVNSTTTEGNEAMTTATPATPAAPEVPAAAAAPAVPAAPAANAAAPQPAASLEALKAHATPEVQAQIDAILAANKSRKDVAIKALEKSGLTSSELDAMSLETLERMVKALPASAPTDFAGAGGTARVNASSDSDAFVKPALVFPINDAGKVEMPKQAA